jgi:hypothetical protein
MAPPESLHDVQKLMGVYGCPEKVHLTTRRQGAHFLQAPQKIGQVLVYQRSTRIFEDLKKYLTTPPTVVAPERYETLQLYISITSNVVSTTIIIEQVELSTNLKLQYPVYFISEVPSDSKTRYFKIMKLGYALLITSHKHSHYF